MTILACDVGGTEIKLGLVRGERILARATLLAEASRGLEPALERVAAARDRLCAESGTRAIDLAGRINLESAAKPHQQTIPALINLS